MNAATAQGRLSLQSYIKNLTLTIFNSIIRC